jgi:hypothetical protein
LIRIADYILTFRAFGTLAYDTENGWYTMNLPTFAIGRYLEDYSTVGEFFSLLSNKEVWKILQQCYFKLSPEKESELHTVLRNKDFIDANNQLTKKGFLVFAAEGHLCYNATLKQDISKTIAISQKIYEVTAIHYGDELIIPANEIIEQLKDAGKWDALESAGIYQRDFEIYLYQMNCHRQTDAFDSYS